MFLVLTCRRFLR